MARLLISTTDGLGDLILRQGLFQALAEAGHSLLLIVRAEHEALLRQIAGAVEVFLLESNPYAFEIPATIPELGALQLRIQTFDPEVLIVAPYQRTPLDEYLLSTMPALRKISFNGTFYRRPGSESQSSWQNIENLERVEVDKHSQEGEKARVLAGYILGRDLILPAPRITVSPLQLELADRILQRWQIKAGEYYFCVIPDEKQGMREWGDDKWIAVLRHLVFDCGKHIVLSGLPEEKSRLEALAEHVSATHCHVAALAELGLGDALGLLSGALAYIGRDSGPMHLAAAIEKRVIALFGGGHWPRFLPVTTEGSAVLTVGVPCQQCDWNCPFPKPYCVTEIPYEAVIGAVDDCENNRLSTGEVRMLEPSHDLSIKMTAEACDKARLLLDARRYSPGNAGTMDVWRQKLETLSRQNIEIEAARQNLAHDLIAARKSIEQLTALAEERSKEIMILTESSELLESSLKELTESYNALAAQAVVSTERRRELWRQLQLEQSRTKTLRNTLQLTSQQLLHRDTENYDREILTRRAMSVLRQISHGSEILSSLERRPSARPAADFAPTADTKHDADKIQLASAEYEHLRVSLERLQSIERDKIYMVRRRLLNWEARLRYRIRKLVG